MPSLFWAMFVWLSFVGGVMMARAVLTLMVSSSPGLYKGDAGSISIGPPPGWRAWLPR